jgi:hypothetical protein
MPTDPFEPDRRSTEPLDTVDFAEPSAPSRPSRRGVVTASVSVLALIAAFGLGAALTRGGSEEIGPAAATSSPSPTAKSDDPSDKHDKAGPPAPGEMRGRMHGPGPLLGAGLGLMGGALHGSAVVEDEDGGYRTVVSQRGDVTSVSATSLTVKSKDGFTATYKLHEDTTDLLGGPEGVGDLKKGDEVAVTGDRKGDVNTATHVVDLSRVQGMLDHVPGLKHRLRPDPTPSPSATTEGSSTGI